MFIDFEGARSLNRMGAKKAGFRRLPTRSLKRVHNAISHVRVSDPFKELSRPSSYEKTKSLKNHERRSGCVRHLRAMKNSRALDYKVIDFWSKEKVVRFEFSIYVGNLCNRVLKINIVRIRTIMVSIETIAFTDFES